MSVATEGLRVRGNGANEVGTPPYFEKRGGPPNECAIRPAAPSPSPRLEISPTFRDRLRRALAIVHRIIGAPDYDGYVAHVRRAHPDRPVLTRDEFVRQRLEDRYSRPGSRCC